MSMHIEAFLLMALGVMVIALRMFARIKLVGFKKLQVDDYLMVVAGVVYAVESGFVYLTAEFWGGLANSNLTPEQRRSLDPGSAEYRVRVASSKSHVAGWQTYLFVLWAIKVAWLVFYRRLVGMLLPRKQVYIGFILLGSTYLAVVLTLLLSCRPLRKYWQIYPDPGQSCYPATSRTNILTSLVLNVITDAYLMAIPIPMILTASFSRLKKFGLELVFSGGFLVTAAGIIRGVLMLEHPDEAGDLSGKWASRESFVAIVTSNVPLIVPLFRRCYGSRSKSPPPPPTTTTTKQLELSRGPGQRPGFGAGGGMYRTTTMDNAYWDQLPPTAMGVLEQRKRSTSLERRGYNAAGPPVDLMIPADDDSDFGPYEEDTIDALTCCKKSLDQDAERKGSEGSCSTAVGTVEDWPVP